MNFYAEAKATVAAAIANGWAAYPKVISQNEYRAMRRKQNLELMRRKRAEWAALGLTSQGKPRKQMGRPAK